MAPPPIYTNLLDRANQVAQQGCSARSVQVKLGGGTAEGMVGAVQPAVNSGGGIERLGVPRLAKAQLHLLDQTLPPPAPFSAATATASSTSPLGFSSVVVSLSASIIQSWTRHHHLLVETDQGLFTAARGVNPRRHWPGREAGLRAGGRTGSAAAPTAAGR